MAKRKRPPPDQLIVPQEAITWTVLPNQEGMRLDRFVQVKLRHNSRNRVQQLIAAREVTANGKPVGRAYRVKVLEEIRLPLPPPPDAAFRIDEIELNIIYEDELLIVLNKQPNIVVHPSGSHLYDTLINALHLRFRNLEDAENDIVPKLAHRIDKETSGVLVAVKTGRHERGSPLVFENTNIIKEYLAIAEGNLREDDFEVNQPLCKEPGGDLNMSLMVVHPDGQAARTGFRVIERFGAFTLVRCRLYTGRQHQIRVHLQSIGHPIVCDKLYGLREVLHLSDLRPLPQDEPDTLLLGRQALHSCRLTFTHPNTGEDLTIQAPLPEDMERTLRTLRE